MGKYTGSLVDVAIPKPPVNKTRLSEKAFTTIFKNEHYVGSNNIYCISVNMCAMIDKFSGPYLTVHFPKVNKFA